MDQIGPVSTVRAPGKFQDPLITAKGEPRASVALRSLDTLWFNTGTMCNLTCSGCYIESSPRNDRLSWLTRAEARGFLDEIINTPLPTRLIGFTGGEPFMNPDIIAMMDDALCAGLRVLVLTNAMRPMRHRQPALLALKHRHADRLTLRVSLDHYTPAGHEAERGPGSWQPTIDGLVWLAEQGFAIDVAGRRLTAEPEDQVRRGYAALFAEHGLPIDAMDPVRLMLFPDMDPTAEVPEITTACWGILHKSPDDVMCATSRMVVKRRGAARASVVACTLVPYDSRFELGDTLAQAGQPIALKHPY